ncbi:hypothetical protein [Streptomyces sp. NPDC090445]|uniref:hypothetical protein n=1 Tax=Streptomyces sp. NPDC090445 TaxID=3365963 RepID=UPI00380AB9A8
MHHETFEPCDVQRLQHAVDYALHASSKSLEYLLPPWIPGDLKREIGSGCVVSHCATLLFPETVESALDYFEENGWTASPTIPSVLVKRRLVERHWLPEDADIRVTRLRVTAGPAPDVEVFLFPRSSPAYEEDVGTKERVHGFENHVGLFMERAEESTLTRLADRLETSGRMVYEGSAHNPHENTTMLYFAPSAPVARVRRRFPRWELQCSGDLTASAGSRPVRTQALCRAYAALKANHMPVDVVMTRAAALRPEPVAAPKA